MKYFLVTISALGNSMLVSEEPIKKGDWCLMFDDFGNLFFAGLPNQYLGEEAGNG